jgi:hypothetical protein
LFDKTREDYTCVSTGTGDDAKGFGCQGRGKRSKQTFKEIPSLKSEQSKADASRLRDTWRAVPNRGGASGLLGKDEVPSSPVPVRVNLGSGSKSIENIEFSRLFSFFSEIVMTSSLSVKILGRDEVFYMQKKIAEIYENENFF